MVRQRLGQEREYRTVGDDDLIKLVISDMDGTLIDRDEVLSDKAVELVRELKARGILFTIATGRVECMADRYVQKLGIEIPYIACNGVTIVQGNKVIQRHKIPLKGLRHLVSQADQMNMSMVYSIDGKETVYKVTPWILSQQQTFNRYYNTHIFSEEEWETLYIDKLMVMDNVRDGSIRYIEEMCNQLGADYGFTRYTNKSIEIVNCQSTKASALRKLVELLGIDMKEVMAIGDHQNDIEMIRECGLGVAVANATDELKAEADYVSRGQCVDGVLEAARKFCIGGE